MIGAAPGILTPVTNAVDYANAGEIDILFPNKAPANGLWFLPRAFLCECKNWNSAVGCNEVKIFTRSGRRTSLRFRATNLYERDYR